MAPAAGRTDPGSRHKSRRLARPTWPLRNRRNHRAGAGAGSSCLFAPWPWFHSSALALEVKRSEAFANLRYAVEHPLPAETPLGIEKEPYLKSLHRSEERRLGKEGR